MRKYEGVLRAMYVTVVRAAYIIWFCKVHYSLPTNSFRTEDVAQKPFQKKSSSYVLARVRIYQCVWVSVKNLYRKKNRGNKNEWKITRQNGRNDSFILGFWGYIGFARWIMRTGFIRKQLFLKTSFYRLTVFFQISNKFLTNPPVLNKFQVSNGNGPKLLRMSSRRRKYLR